MAGYTIGKFMPKGGMAFALCIPVSIALYAVLKLVMAGSQDAILIISGGILQSPVLMLGLYLARRSSQRNKYESE